MSNYIIITGKSSICRDFNSLIDIVASHGGETLEEALEIAASRGLKKL